MRSSRGPEGKCGRTKKFKIEVELKYEKKEKEGWLFFHMVVEEEVAKKSPQPEIFGEIGLRDGEFSLISVHREEARQNKLASGEQGRPMDI